MSSKFNQIPRQCEGRCELEQEYVDKHGIVLTRNCDGPGMFTSTPDDRVLVVDGDVAGLDLETGGYRESSACRNGGFVIWLAEKENAHLRATADLPDLE